MFSHQSYLISLELDISGANHYVHQCLQESFSLSNTGLCEFHSCSTTLRYLRINIEYKCFLEDLIEFVPNLEELSIRFRHSLYRFDSEITTRKLSDQKWFNKVRSIAMTSILEILNKEMILKERLLKKA